MSLCWNPNVSPLNWKLEAGLFWSFVVLFIVLYKVVLTCECVHETVACSHSSESYWALFLHLFFHFIAQYSAFLAHSWSKTVNRVGNFLSIVWKRVCNCVCLKQCLELVVYAMFWTGGVSDRLFYGRFHFKINIIEIACRQLGCRKCSSLFSVLYKLRHSPWPVGLS